MGNISLWQLLILLLIVMLVFGTKRLRNMGSDLGSAVKGFRKGMEGDEDPASLESDGEKPAPAEKSKEERSQDI